MTARKAVPAISVAAVAFGIAACGSTSVTTKPVTAPTTSGSKAVIKAKAVPIAHVGSALAVTGEGTKATVTLVMVIDPAKGADQFTTPDAGTRFVGIKFRIVDTGAAISDSADDDVSITGTDDQSYSSALSNIKGCTDFADGQITMAPGDTSVGCVVFQLPRGVKVARVRFALELGVEGTSGEWTVR